METAKIEVELLKQRVIHHYLSPLFDSFQLPTLLPALETIQDESIRQRLIYRYEQLIQRTKSEIILIHISSAEVKMNETNKQFENDQKQFLYKLRTSYCSSTLKRTLTEIMDRRFNLVEQRLKTLLDLKVHFFVKAPTVNKKH